MLASFTNMNCESQNPDNGNPLRFYPLEKRSNIYFFRSTRKARAYSQKLKSETDETVRAHWLIANVIQWGDLVSGPVVQGAPEQAPLG